MTVSHWQTDFPRPTEEVDVLVVGAGLIGCAAAYFAHEAGHDVTWQEFDGGHSVPEDMVKLAEQWMKELDGAGDE